VAEALDVFWHPDVLLHDTGRGVFEGRPSPLLAEQEPHPESPLRLRNMKAILERGPVAELLRWREGRLARADELELVHEPRYVEQVRRACLAEERLTATTPVSARSFDAALAAAGTAIAATEAVVTGECLRAYALVRPPGHHAQRAQADGYCLFNNVALAAERARRLGVERVAVLDWDVHHGNGTQECFYERSDVLTISLHMRHGAWGPTHRQTGGPDETGRGPGAGYNVNVELPLGTGDAGYVLAMDEIVLPVLDRFEPDLLVIACGQDASQFDPNGRQAVTMAGFRRLGEAARAVAERHAQGRLVLVQEGGYAPTYAAFCLFATVEGVLGAPPQLPDPLAYLPDDPEPARAAIGATRAAIEGHWRL
jgi:acetoin utilization deacetylase AcuC-like enzyme